MGSKRLFVLVLLLGAAGFGLLCSAGGPVVAGENRADPFSDSAVEFVPGELIVGFEGSVAGVEDREAVVEAAGAKYERDLLLPGYSLVLVPSGDERVSAGRLTSMTGVVSVEPNLIRRALLVPSDEWYGLQWNFSQIGVEEAWDKTLGAGVTVAVLDSGVAYEDCAAAVCGQTFAKGPDFAQTSFVSPWDFVGGDSHANDQTGHGTHVASTIAESTNNGIGAAGIAPNSSIMPIRVLDATGSGTLEEEVNGLVYAADQGADVINLSLGAPGTAQSERDAVNYAFERDAVVVAATGNGGADGVGDAELVCPACYEGVIAVGATTRAQTIASYSNYGIGEPGQSVVLVAPGGTC